MMVLAGTPLRRASQYLGEGIDDPVEDGWRGGEGEPQVPVIAPADRVGGGGFQQDAEPCAFSHHFMGGAGVEVEPQGDSARRTVPAELRRADAAQSVFQVPEVFGQQPRPPLNDRIKRGQQLGSGDLVERARARAHHGGGAP